MTLNQRIIALAKSIGGDVKALIEADGDLTELTTAAKENLVVAINEVRELASQSSGAKIDDSATNGATTVVWSADKVYDAILEARNELKNELTGDAGAALDTLGELADVLGNNPNFATEIARGMAKRVRVDAAQTFTTAEKQQGCNNLGIGNPDYDFVAGYNTAKTGA
ncbi:hypothetical protein [Psychrobacter pygoscelis]|uniref:hypothetical protein n=1 Tax=Psychrobacter pygoscelis TaxID=2488563 RepID=UPI001039195E|nr:hypothetical protein [Psychrobacter pygoscelis]